MGVTGESQGDISVRAFPSAISHIEVEVSINNKDLDVVLDTVTDSSASQTEGGILILNAQEIINAAAAPTMQYGPVRHSRSLGGAALVADLPSRSAGEFPATPWPVSQTSYNNPYNNPSIHHQQIQHNNNNNNNLADIIGREDNDEVDSLSDRSVAVDMEALREGREQIAARQQALQDAMAQLETATEARGHEYYIGDSSLYNTNEGLQGTLAYLDTPLGVSVGACVKCLVLVSGQVVGLTEIEAVVDAGTF